MPDADHPLWAILTGLLIALTAFAALWANYNHLDTRDTWTICEVMLAYFVAHWGKQVLTREKA